MAEENKKETRKFVLPRRDRVPVETTLGQFFARHFVIRDMSTFDNFLQMAGAVSNEDYEEIGRRALLTLVEKHAAGESEPALDSDSLSTLAPGDISALGQAIGSEWSATAVHEPHNQVTSWRLATEEHDLV